MRGSGYLPSRSGTENGFTPSAGSAPALRPSDSMVIGTLPNGITLRTAREEESGEVFGLLRNIWGDYEHRMSPRGELLRDERRRWRSSFENPETQYTFVWDRGRVPIAYSCLSIPTPLQYGTLAGIIPGMQSGTHRICKIGELAIAVSKERRSGGLGSTLMQAAMEQARKRNICVLVRYVDENNGAGLRLADKFGFGTVELTGLKSEGIITTYLVLDP